ncbi:Uu.00g077730.m01.CDS01 [Anthostomella pinea]|uniref:Uu.00g077730.m01.CDS01 n=1 Tax=Anthostomella pinea TaxID=933095 RepID=A0AAI8YJ33_9PEZI|nr:Uu.00g077730.m01.CDS01 [Anthostomella pinea]
MTTAEAEAPPLIESAEPTLFLIVEDQSEPQLKLAEALHCAMSTASLLSDLSHATPGTLAISDPESERDGVMGLHSDSDHHPEIIKGKMSYGTSRFWFLIQYLEDPTTFNLIVGRHPSANLWPPWFGSRPVPRKNLAYEGLNVTVDDIVTDHLKVARFAMGKIRGTFGWSDISVNSRDEPNYK